MKDRSILVSGFVVYKLVKGGKPQWFLVKQKDKDGWEIPKTPVRRGESSVRASIRATSENAGMRANILEEIGRASGQAKIAGKSVSQKIIYYLMICKDQGEILGYGMNECEWVSFPVFVKRIVSKREVSIAKSAKKMMTDIEKKKKAKRAKKIS